jgi:lipopolysaccharide export system protein LptA
VVSKPAVAGSDATNIIGKAPTLEKGPRDIGRGRGAWYSSYEGDRLKSRFRAAEYVPLPNGKIAVVNPEAEFFMPNGQKMRLIGTDGEVVVPESSGKGPPGPTGEFSSGAPNRGRIHTVTIELFNMYSDSRPGKPDEIMNTDNINFDNETMLITTEAFVDGGKLVLADQVPVKMRSQWNELGHERGYDLDGRGMQLRWNDKDGRLDLLEIAHGESLTIKDSSSSSSVLGGTERQAKGPATAPAVTLAMGGAPAAVPVAGNDQGAADSLRPASVASAHVASAVQPTAPAVAPTPATTGTPAAKKEPPPVPVPYWATFYDNVRITQGPDVLITADRMDVDFVSGQKQTPATAPAAHPAGTPATTPSDTATATNVVHADPSPTTHAVATTQPATTAPIAMAAPTTKPATQPANQPVVIHWTGKMHMASAKAGRPRVNPGFAIVDLTGKVVTVRRTPAGQVEGDDVRAARLIYQNEDGRVRLFNSQAEPQVVISKLVNGQIDPRSTITTETLDYIIDKPTGTKVAVLTGAGHALMPMEAGGAKPGAAGKAGEAVMDAHWKRGANVYFAGKGDEQSTIEQIDLAGDVDVKHPQLVMNSQTLSLYFEPPAKPATRPVDVAALPASNPAATQPTTGPALANAKPQQELKRVIAREAVHCVMAGQNGKTQTIDCENLDMQTARSAEGKIYARTVNTQGHVHARDSEQDLRGDSVYLTLKPAVPDLKKLAATQPSPETRPAADGIKVAATQLSPETRPATNGNDAMAVELETMIARKHVRAVNKDGSVATAAELIVTTEGGEQHVRLIGSGVTDDDNKDARVTDIKKNVITGPIITMEPKQSIAHVLGPGTMHVLQEQADGSPPRPMDVKWTDHADMSGPADRVDVIGNVAVHAVDADGTVNDATGDRIQIDLMKKVAPATQPATQPVTQPTVQPAVRPAPVALATTQPTTRPAKKGTADGAQMDLMKDKDVRTITIIGTAKVVSVLSGPDGNILRQMALFAPKIIYQLADSKDLPAKSLFVPSAGQMLVGDHRPPEKPKPGADNTEMSSSRGNTAFQWNKNLTYTDERREAIMNGDVYVKHRPDEKDGNEIEVRHSDQVTAWFEPVKVDKPATNPVTAPSTLPATNAASTAGTLPATTTASTTAPATRPVRAADPGSSMQLKHLIADGRVEINRAGGTLFADQVDYDPISHWMIARGSQNRPAHYEDPDPKKSLTAGQMEWNTVSWNIKMSNPKSSHP